MNIKGMKDVYAGYLVSRNFQRWSISDIPSKRSLTFAFTILGQFCETVGIIFEIMGLFWDNFWTILEQFWDNF